MRIKAIMCDIDGTLLNDEGKVTPKTLQAIKDVKDRGIMFGLSTGRDVHSVKTLCKHWGIEGLVDAIVGTGGAEIYDFHTNTGKDSYPLDGSLIRSIIEHYEDMDVNFAIPYQGILYAPKDDRHIQSLSKADKVPYQVVDFNEFLKQPRPKVMIVCDPEKMNDVIKRSKTFHDDRFKSSALKTASILFEYMDPRISKTHGLKRVMELYHLTMDELCTFGDADNDYDMTLHAGIGVIMKNGSEKCKMIADHITDDNNHDGIANFINTFILQ